MGKSFRQKISKETLSFNNTLEMIALIDIYRTFFFPKTVDSEQILKACSISPVIKEIQNQNHNKILLNVKCYVKYLIC